MAAFDLGGVRLERKDVETDVTDRQGGDLPGGDDTFTGLAGDAERETRNDGTFGPAPTEEAGCFAASPGLLKA